MTKRLIYVHEAMTAVDHFLTTKDIAERSRLAGVLSKTMEHLDRQALGGHAEGYVMLVNGVVVRGPGTDTGARN